jgi:hypothetical protein
MSIPPTKVGGYKYVSFGQHQPVAICGIRGDLPAGDAEGTFLHTFRWYSVQVSARASEAASERNYGE